MCNRRFMPSPRLPAPSLRSAYCLPAGRVLLWASNYLICIVLRPIQGVVRGVKSKVLPALREATGRRSLEPRAEAVDVAERRVRVRDVIAILNSCSTRRSGGLAVLHQGLERGAHRGCSGLAEQLLGATGRPHLAPVQHNDPRAVADFVDQMR